MAAMREDKNGGPNFLRAWRLRAGLTQAELAERVGTSHNQIQHLESGERALSARWLRRLAPEVGTTAGLLLGLDPNDPAAELHTLIVRLRPSDRLQRQLVAVIEALAKVDGAVDAEG